MMWSGDPQYSQWALNPSTYQNIAHEEVDWAALAQQWIQMKETHPSDQIPPAPPPPPIGDKSDSGDKKKDSELEGGEAPMDMDTKEDNSNSSNTQSGDANSWNSWPNWQQWGWNWSATGGMVPPGGVPPPNQSLGQDKGSTSTSTMGVPPYSYPHNSQAYTSGTGVYDYNHAGGSDHYSQYKDGRDMEHSQHVKRGSEVMASGYWTSGGSADTGGVPPGPGGGPSPFIRHNRHDWRRNNRSHDRLRTSEKSDDEEDTTTVLDAAKRRQLPAWIREGLEKMEREKQKKIDRERQIKEREAYLQKKREEEENAMNELEKNAGQPMIPKKSKFESDSEESARGDSPTPSQSSLKRKSRFRNADSPNSSPRHPTARFPSTEPEPVKSREELMQEVINTHPRLTIGVPPVSGSKATASKSSSSANTTNLSHSYNRCNLPSSTSMGEASTPVVSASGVSSKHRNTTVPYSKKVTTTSKRHNKSFLSEAQNPGLEFQNMPSHIIMEQNCPSLKECSISGKVNSKPGHGDSSTVLNNASMKASEEETPSSNIVCSNVTAANRENIAEEIPCHSEVSCEERLKPQSIEVCAEATVLVPRQKLLFIAEELVTSEEVSVEAIVTIPRSSLSTIAGNVPSEEASTEATVIITRRTLCHSKNLIPSEVSVEATVMVPPQIPDVSAAETVMNSSEEGMTLKTGRRKRHSPLGRNVLPAVIIMNEQEQENYERISGLTFGFEVNEQLLLSDGDGNSCCDSSSLVEESNTITNSVAGDTTAEESVPLLPVITNSVSETFSARFRAPVAEQSELHDTIVAYVANAWGAVVKEMKAPVHARGVVRYYSGQ